MICESRETQILPTFNPVLTRPEAARRASASPRTGTLGDLVVRHHKGLGDLCPSFLLSRAHPGKLVWSVGPTFLLPTATDPTLGQGKWGAGPSIVLLTQRKHWTVGVLAINIWSSRATSWQPVNEFLGQYFVTRNFKHGWFLKSAPNITAVWRAPDNNKWIVPFGGGFRKMTRFFGQRMVWQMHLYYNAVHPQDLPYPKWQVLTWLGRTIIPTSNKMTGVLAINSSTVMWFLS